MILTTLLLSAVALAELPDETLPEAEVIEERTEAVDLTDEDDIEFEAPTVNAVPEVSSTPTRPEVDLAAYGAITPTALSAGPMPRLPSVEHVDFEDDFDFDASRSAEHTASAGSAVQLQDLDEEPSKDIAVEDVEENQRVELPEGMADELPEEASPAATSEVPEDTRALLEDEDDFAVDW